MQQQKKSIVSLKVYLLFLFFCLYSTLFSQEKYNLELNLKKGEHFQFSSSSEEILNSTSGLASKRIDNNVVLFAKDHTDSLEIKRTFNYEIAFEVLQIGIDTIYLEAKYKNLRLEIQPEILNTINNELSETIDIDSLNIAFNSILNMPFHINLLKNGRIASIDGLLETVLEIDKSYQNIKDDDLKAYYYSQFEKSFNEGVYSDLFVSFPNNFVSINEEWVTEELIKLGEKTFTVYHTHTLKEVTENYYIIDVKSIFEDEFDIKLLGYESQFTKIKTNIDNTLYVDRKSGLINRSMLNSTADIDSGYFNSYSETYLNGIAFRWKTTLNGLVEKLD